MNVFDDVKRKLAGVVGRAKDNRAARVEKAESDVDADPDVAGSRASLDGGDGSYVGRTGPQFDADIQQSGAEARSEVKRQADNEP